jgi:predicted DNA-binding transcriptional regulator AlpA
MTEWLASGYPLIMNYQASAVAVSARHSLYLTDVEVAELLRISVSTVRRWRLARVGGPKWVRISSSVRYARADVESFMASLPSGGGLQPEAR